VRDLKVQVALARRHSARAVTAVSAARTRAELYFIVIIPVSDMRDVSFLKLFRRLL
jgi:hypothetical protein